VTPLVTVIDRPLPPVLFRQLVRRVRALGDERLRKTYQTTFWFDFQQPAAVTEEVILALRPRLPHAPVSGVEWWLSRMWTHDVRVDFHRDRDEALAKRTGRERHPRISSILFLNRVRGGALVVTRQRPDPRNPALVPLPLEGDLVAPRPHRFAWFDGKLTHGVLDAGNQVPVRGARRGGELRLALIMNWWRRKPTDVPPWTSTLHYRALRVPSGPRRRNSRSAARP
jgi:hypothetical protein